MIPRMHTINYMQQPHFIWNHCSFFVPFSNYIILVNTRCRCHSHRCWYPNRESLNLRPCALHGVYNNAASIILLKNISFVFINIFDYVAAKWFEPSGHSFLYIIAMFFSLQIPNSMVHAKIMNTSCCNVRMNECGYLYGHIATFPKSNFVF